MATALGLRGEKGKMGTLTATPSEAGGSREAAIWEARQATERPPPPPDIVSRDQAMEPNGLFPIQAI